MPAFSVTLQENQKDLEQSTEKLSEYLEREISVENLVDIKQKVQDKYRLEGIQLFSARQLNSTLSGSHACPSFFRYCESRKNVLLDHVHEGYDKDWWLYTESDAKP